eukprot:jgi/Chlat1/3537/Chrsp23S03704
MRAASVAAAAASLLRRAAQSASRFVSSAATQAASASEASTSGRATTGAVLLLAAPCAAAAGLGMWQLQRRQWKVELLERRSQRLAEPPEPLGNLATGPDPSRLEYRRVRCEGRFDDSKSLFIGPRVRSSGPNTVRGYLLVTPFINSDGRAPHVLVNRGWVPEDWRENLSKHSQGEHVAVTGIFRGSEEPSAFVPPNVPSTGTWFYLDMPAMLKACDLPEGTPFVEAISEHDAGTSFSPPVMKEPADFLTFNVMPNHHIHYALTWFTLSAVTSYMAWRRVGAQRLAKPPR